MEETYIGNPKYSVQIPLTRLKGYTRWKAKKHYACQLALATLKKRHGDLVMYHFSKTNRLIFMLYPWAHKDNCTISEGHLRISFYRERHPITPSEQNELRDKIKAMDTTELIPLRGKHFSLDRIINNLLKPPHGGR